MLVVLVCWLLARWRLFLLAALCLSLSLPPHFCVRCLRSPAAQSAFPASVLTATVTVTAVMVVETTSDIMVEADTIVTVTDSATGTTGVVVAAGIDGEGATVVVVVVVVVAAGRGEEGMHTRVITVTIMRDVVIVAECCEQCRGVLG